MAEPWKPLNLPALFSARASGRYRVTADMSLGSGIVGNIPLGSAQASCQRNNDKIDLNNLTANVMNGLVNGNATIAFNVELRRPLPRISRTLICRSLPQCRAAASSRSRARRLEG